MATQPTVRSSEPTVDSGRNARCLYICWRRIWSPPSRCRAGTTPGVLAPGLHAHRHHCLRHYAELQLRHAARLHLRRRPDRRERQQLQSGHQPGWPIRRVRFDGDQSGLRHHGGRRPLRRFTSVNTCNIATIITTTPTNYLRAHHLPGFYARRHRRSATDDSSNPSISEDGLFVSFTSTATNLGSTAPNPNGLPRYSSAALASPRSPAPPTPAYRLPR